MSDNGAGHGVSSWFHQRPPRAGCARFSTNPRARLLAVIDNYGPIFVGAQRTIRAPVSGRVYFGVNDDHLADNRGEFAVNVNVGVAR